ncbi:MAG TPA: hypothetical protein PLO25_03440 [Candidatus Saccharibacteria bacterium]|nr:hypothetical protein [Candidatus Saccharibacteria bacterium]
MNKSQRTYRGGSIVNFVVIGVVLSFLLIGGIYLVKQRGEQARKEQVIAELEKQEESEQKNNTESDNSNSKDLYDTNKSTDSNSDNNTVSAPMTGTSELPQTGADVNLIKIAGIFLSTFILANIFCSYRKI